MLEQREAQDPVEQDAAHGIDDEDVGANSVPLGRRPYADLDDGVEHTITDYMERMAAIARHSWMFCQIFPEKHEYLVDEVDSSEVSYGPSASE